MSKDRKPLLSMNPALQSKAPLAAWPRPQALRILRGIMTRKRPRSLITPFHIRTCMAWPSQHTTTFTLYKAISETCEDELC